MIKFTVYGQAKPAGSKRAVPMGKRWGVIDANPKSGAWKDEVAQVAGRTMAANGNDLLRGPISVTFAFYRRRPKAHFNSKGLVKTSAARYPTAAPDLLKTARGVEDALSGVVYADDAQIVFERLEKHYGEPERVEIVVQELGHQSTNGAT